MLPATCCQLLPWCKAAFTGICVHFGRQRGVKYPANPKNCRTCFIERAGGISQMALVLFERGSIFEIIRYIAHMHFHERVYNDDFCNSQFLAVFAMTYITAR
jgi:hypothetical protein